MEPRPKIFGYTNYRQFLSDFYAFMKQGKHGYSFRQFSQAAGFIAPNVLKLAMSGERNLSSASIDKFIKALALPQNQAEYFRCLVQWNQATTDAMKAEYFAKLQRLTPSSRRYQLEADAVEYLSHWVYPVLREMVTFQGFRDDPYWIQRRLSGRIELKTIVHALNFLKAKGFIEKRSDGLYFVKDEIVISSDEVKNFAVRSYHRRVLEQAIEVLEDLPVEQREFGALIFQLPDSALPELKRKLKTFRQELHRWSLEQSQGPEAKRVVQLNLQMFPQSKEADT